MEKLRLTQTVQKGGCAAKVAAVELRKILGEVRFPKAPSELLVDSSTFDDAAIYRLNEAVALVQTLDFFTPIVDTPKLFGRIAAANALSDVYAMGGKPITAMAIFAFPVASLANEVAVDVLQGASDVIAESGAALAGGHTIDDDTMKFGLSVTGLVHPEKIWTNAGAKTGDILILTKPLGTGTSTAALKRGEVTEADIQDVMDSMGQLNDVPSILSELQSSAVHAATDITGFGLAGHALNMARASGVTLNFRATDLPFFERSRELITKGFLTKAHRTNRDYAESEVVSQVDSTTDTLLYDPQTSGGLLLAIAAADAVAVLRTLRVRFPRAAMVGTVGAAGQQGLRFE